MIGKWVKGLFRKTPGPPAPKTAGEVPKVIYREGNPAPSNLNTRPGEDAVSFRDSLSNPLPKGDRPVFRPGENYFGIDTSKLPQVLSFLIMFHLAMGVFKV